MEGGAVRGLELFIKGGDEQERTKIVQESTKHMGNEPILEEMLNRCQIVKTGLDLLGFKFTAAQVNALLAFRRLFLSLSLSLFFFFFVSS
jgi:hypothetical protein